MAEYAETHDRFVAQGVEMVALSVDDVSRSRLLKARLKLPFRLLSDPARQVVTAWGLYNPKEAGGIALPGTFILGPGRRVELAAVHETVMRVDASGVLAFLAEGAAPVAHAIKPGVGNFARATLTIARYGMTSPRPKP